MTNKSFIARALAATALAAGALAAHAGTLTMGGWLFGSGHNVAVSTPTYSGAAGGFKGALSGMSDPTFNLNPVEMYCVDLHENINIGSGTTYSVKMAGEADSTTFTLMSASSVLDAPIVARLGQLISYAESSASIVNTSGESTALQLAIWNTLYDTDSTLSSGGFLSNDSSYRDYANTLLANSTGFAVTKDLYVLRSEGSPGRQDQLIWISHNVPEPGTLALASIAVAGLGFVRRRRR